VSESKRSQFFFMKIKQLPKPEYKLQKGLIEHYGLDDTREVFVVALRLWYEYMHSAVGEKHIKEIINVWRNNQLEDRQYDLPKAGE
jgi:hypothetical protein